MKRRPKDYLIEAPDDGLDAPEVGPWAAEKYRRVGMYSEIFSTGMKNQWPTRVYIDLFSGSGHALLRDPKRRVLTSPLLALSVPDRFSKYIYCDQDAHRIEVLRKRAEQMAPETPMEFVIGDANQRVTETASHIPPHSETQKVLSFCFVDPFGLDIHFETIRHLGAARAMDFLILLALGMDATRNWTRYLRADNEKVARFLGEPMWRERWREAEAHGETPIRFLAMEYARVMNGLGYRTTSLDQMIEVKTYDNNMRLYYLAFFSKSQRGYDFWLEVQKYSTDQLRMLL
ncbi:MAG: three-Cys-motif partner protein TcmP [Gemmatimonadota bacterium]|nr:three-Cys-motif partner protein TcmP [Gemmatimonadota bacterium]